MLKSKKLPSYSDGVASVWREKPRKTSFGAKRNPAAYDDLELVAKLCFRRMSLREQDYSFAEQLGFNCAAKVAAHSLKSVEVGCKAVILGDIYNIKYIDRTPTEMFLYMEGGAPFGDDS